MSCFKLMADAANHRHKERERVRGTESGGQTQKSQPNDSEVMFYFLFN